LEEYQKSIDLPISDNGLQIAMARILATRFKNENEVNRIFSRIRHDYKSYIAWAQLALGFSNLSKVRSIFQQASKKSLDNSDLVYQEWIDFELIHGSPEDLQKCLSQVCLAKEKNAYNLALKKEKELDENQSVMQPSEAKIADIVFQTDSQLEKKREREEDTVVETDLKKIKKEENQKIGDFTTYKVIPKYFL
jgi:hypothetical protein